MCFSSLVVANEGKGSGQHGNLKLIPFTVAQIKQRSESNLNNDQCAGIKIKLHE
jgi:hypothetical protein